MISIKASPVFLHLFAWLIFLTIPLIFMTQDGTQGILKVVATFPYLQFCFLYILIFYVHTEVLIPRLFIEKKYILYWLILLLMLASVFVLKPFDKLVSISRAERGMEMNGFNRPNDFDRGPPGGFNGGDPPPDRPYRDGQPSNDDRYDNGFRPNNDRNNRPGSIIPGSGPALHFDITGIFIFFMMIGLGSAIQAIKQWRVSEKRAILAEAQKATAELSFLKAQINPHFLYNTLNNIYTLCIIGSEHAAESVMKLSKIMRYITDESEAEFVPLQDEIDCISNFIALQKLRLGSMVTLNYNITGDPTGKRVMPLAFMTFIENSFKYGLSNHQEATIDISVAIEKSRIVFATRNQIFDHQHNNETGNQEANKRKGLGIENTKRRLEYTYPDAHTLTINSENSYFSILLILADN